MDGRRLGIQSVSVRRVFAWRYSNFDGGRFLCFLDILDEEERPVAIGSPGTMWAGGRGIFEGYLNLPRLNQERLKPDPYRGEG